MTEAPRTARTTRRTCRTRRTPPQRHWQRWRQVGEDVKWNATEASASAGESASDSMRVTETTGLSAEQPPWMAITPGPSLRRLTWNSGQDGMGGWYLLDGTCSIATATVTIYGQRSYCGPTARCAFVTELFVNWSNLCLFYGKLRLS